MNETDLMNEIRLALSKTGFAVFRANVGKFKLNDGRFLSTGLPKGFSDLFAVKNGRVYFIEVKVKPNKPTGEQLSFIEQMKEKGCGAGVAYSIEDAFKICGVRYHEQLSFASFGRIKKKEVKSWQKQTQNQKNKNL